MPVRDLSSLFAATFDYPAVPSAAHPNGKTYRVASPPAGVGATLTAQAAIGFKMAAGGTITEAEQALLDLDDDQEQTFYQEILGDVYDQMIADGVSWSLLASVARDAYLCITDNQPLADAVLSAGEAQARKTRATLSKTEPVSRKAGSRSKKTSGRTPARTAKPRATTRTAGPSSTSPDDAETSPPLAV